MARKESNMQELTDILRRFKAGDSKRKISRDTQTDRKTVQKYLKIVQESGMDVQKDEPCKIALLLHQELYRQEKARPEEYELLKRNHGMIRNWIENDQLSLVKIRRKLVAIGIRVSYARLYRYIQDQPEMANRKNTVRKVDYQPGDVAEVDYCLLGRWAEPGSEKKRKVYALIVTLVSSRHQYVHVCFRSDLATLIDGLENGWEFFGGVTKRVILDNLKAAVVKTKAYETEFNRQFQAYSEYRDFIIDNTRPSDPKGKPQVERQVQYVRNDFFRGEEFRDKADMQSRAEVWCKEEAGLRIHGTTRKYPLVEFEETEKPVLMPLEKERYETPTWHRRCVHADHHVLVENSGYSVPTRYIGKEVEVKADSRMVRIYFRGEEIKIHPRMEPGKWSTDPNDYPEAKREYALRDSKGLIEKASAGGEFCGQLATGMFEGVETWQRLREARKLISLIHKYGAEEVNQACRRSLEFESVKISTVINIIEKRLVGHPAHFCSEGSVQASVANRTYRFERTADYYKKAGIRTR